MGILSDFFTLLNNVRNYRIQNTTDQDVQDFFDTWIKSPTNAVVEPETIDPGQLVFVEDQNGGTLYVGGSTEKKKIIAINDLASASDLDDNELLMKTTIDGVPVFIGKSINAVTSGAEYSAALSQSGTNPPVIETGIINQQSEDVQSCSYLGVGNFSINFNGVIFPMLNGPDFLVFRNQDISFGGVLVGKMVLDEVNTTNSSIAFYTLDPAGNPANGLLGDGFYNTNIYFKTYQ